MKRVLITMSADVLTMGHVKILQYAKSLGFVAVAVDSDELIKQRKGKDRPFNVLKDRMDFLYALKSVDEVFSFNSEKELVDICELFVPDIRVVGSDWKDKEIVGAEYCKEILYFNRIEPYSTTRILNYGKSK